MRLVLTGAHGFLGWHVRVLARAKGLPDLIVADRDELGDPLRFGRLVAGADRLLHLAGVNRGEVAGNVALAERVARGLERCEKPPGTVVFANSVQAGNGTEYGEAKAKAAELLAAAAQWSGSSFVDARLPNLFGEHGRPRYNSVVATFCQLLADGGEAEVHHDRELDLWHATDAAALLLGLTPPRPPVRRSVAQLARQLGDFARAYARGELPDLADDFAVRLFNTYRSHCSPGRPRVLARHADSRGELVETVKSHGGGGQSFVSGTKPGVTRGQHFHLSKVERFVVLRGDAEIRLRRMFHDEVIRLRVSGGDPVAVDMPAMWAHDITNTGANELLTLFWANEVFDPARPDTYPELVQP